MATLRRSDVDMTTGSITRHILTFAFPLLLGNLFQQFYNLVDTFVVGNFASNEAYAAVGVEVNGEMLDEYSRINDSLWKMLERGEIEKERLVYHRFELFYKKYGFDADARLTANEYTRTLSNKAYIIDGADGLCLSLYGKAKMYIVTNGIRSNQESRLALCGLMKYFDGAFISDIVGFEKPKVEFFDGVAAHIPELDRSRTVIVGDSLSSDIQGGINYSIDTCWYNPEGKCAPDRFTGKITSTVKNYNEMYIFLTKGD